MRRNFHGSECVCDVVCCGSLRSSEMIVCWKIDVLLSMCVSWPRNPSYSSLRKPIWQTGRVKSKRPSPCRSRCTSSRCTTHNTVIVPECRKLLAQFGPEAKEFKGGSLKPRNRKRYQRFLRPFRNLAAIIARQSPYQHLLDAIAVHRVADRPDRYEPRLRKRRPNHYGFLRKSRRETQRTMREGLPLIQVPFVTSTDVNAWVSPVGRRQSVKLSNQGKGGGASERLS